MDKDEVVYAISVEDLLAVAKVSYGTELSEEQVKLLADKVGDYFADCLKELKPLLMTCLV